jgi:hypothetical protein
MDQLMEYARNKDVQIQHETDRIKALEKKIAETPRYHPPSTILAKPDMIFGTEPKPDRLEEQNRRIEAAIAAAHLAILSDHHTPTSTTSTSRTTLMSKPTMWTAGGDAGADPEFMKLASSHRHGGKIFTFDFHQNKAKAAARKLFQTATIVVLRFVEEARMATSMVAHCLGRKFPAVQPTVDQILMRNVAMGFADRVYVVGTMLPSPPLAIIGWEPFNELRRIEADPAWVCTAYVLRIEAKYIGWRDTSRSKPDSTVALFFYGSPSPYDMFDKSLKTPPAAEWYEWDWYNRTWVVYAGRVVIPRVGDFTYATAGSRTAGYGALNAIGSIFG